MTLITGTDILVKIGVKDSEEKIYCSTNCVLTLNQATISASCKDSEQWEQAIEGQKSWSVSVEGLYDQAPDEGKGFVDLADLIITGPNSSSVLFGLDTVENDVAWQGDAILESCALTGPDNEFATWTAEFKGNGPLAKILAPA